MLLLLAHHYDAEAQWLYQMLDKSYRLPVAYLVPEALGLDYNISLRLNNSGQHGATVTFNKLERRLESSEVYYAINRLSYIDPILWRKAEPSEKTYAASELNAFFSALIQSLPCPVSNRIHNGALYGDVGFAARWAARMHERGLSVDSSVIDDAGKSHEKLSAMDAGELYRFLYNGEGILTPSGQATLPHEKEIKDCMLSDGDDETLEVIFQNENSIPRLLHISKVPSLSCYGTQYPEALVQKMERYKYDSTYRHSERTTLAAAC